MNSTVSAPIDDAYREDLAYIHDVGFGHLARSAADELLKQLARHKHASGLVVDLGCGSGILSERVSNAGYDILGIDLSPAMVALARQRVPRGEFRAASILDAKLPTCTAVAAVGEIVNYLFDRRNSATKLQQLLRKVHRALVPGGVCLFDVAAPGRAPGGSASNYQVGNDWACLHTATEDRSRQLLTREIITFRRQGDLYRRDHEIHRLRLFPRSQVIADLRRVGFRVLSKASYGDTALPAGLYAFVAVKPATSRVR